MGIVIDVMLRFCVFGLRIFCVIVFILVCNEVDKIIDVI